MLISDARTVQGADIQNEIRPLRAIFEDLMSDCAAVVKGLNV